MLVIGLTGGIGSGKTTVANLFGSLGITIIDTDVISHGLTHRDSETMDEIREHFGVSVFLADGELDRRALAERIFRDTDERHTLESIMHPHIRREVMHQIKQHGDEPYLIVVVPLLFESGFDQIVDRVLSIDCPEDLQIERAVQRDQRTAGSVQDIIDNQIDRETRRSRADDVIDNSGGLDALRRAVGELDAAYRQISAAPVNRDPMG